MSFDTLLIKSDVKKELKVIWKRLEKLRNKEINSYSQVIHELIELFKEVYSK
jgi:predicted CopG family antitoxin